MKKVCRGVMSLLLVVIMVLEILVNNMPIEAATKYDEIELSNVPYYPQKIKGDCGISSIAMIEAQALGLGLEHYDAVYEGVFQANIQSGKQPSFEISGAKNGYKSIKKEKDADTLEEIYKELQKGNPVLIYRVGKNNNGNHWSVIIGYNGSTQKLSKSGFIVHNTATEVSLGKTYKTDDDLKSWLGNYEWKYAYVRTTGAINSVTKTVSTLTLENAYYLKNLKVGSGMSPTGLLISNGIIKSVEVGVKNSKGEIVFSSGKITPNSKYYGLMNTDAEMKFGSKCSSGTYTYYVKAKDSTGASIDWSKEFKVSSSGISFAKETVSGMTLNQSNVTIDFGEVIVLQVTSELPSGKTVTWKSSDNDIAYLMPNETTAIITGGKAGTATITATCGSAVASCTVTVKSNGSSGATENTIQIKDKGASNITENTARISASINPGAIVTEAGFYIGTSKNNLKQVKESVGSYAESMWYDLGTGKWYNALTPDTTYYYQLYAVINGKTYKTSVSSFKTAKGETYELTNTGVSNLTTTTAKIKAKLSPGVKIEKAGFYYGESSTNMTKKTETVNAYTESIWYELGTGKWCKALSPNTTYYYQIYVVINGTEYKSPLGKFKTAKNTIEENSTLYTSVTSSDITQTSAKIKANYPKNTYDDAGFYFGTSSDLSAMKKTSEYVHGGSPSVSYTNSYKLGVKYDNYGYKWSDPLEAGTKYYYAFYLVLDGKEYISTVNSFTTTGNAKITDVDISSYPTKRDYVVGEKIDTSGLKLTVEYSNGKTETITKGVTVSGDTSTVGTKKITLKYGGETFTYNIKVTQPLASISLKKTSLNMNVSDVEMLSVIYNPTDTTDDKSVTWNSSNTEVATVSGGMITAVSGGTATITATCGTKTATCKITVKNLPTVVTLNKTSALLVKSGETVNLSATVGPDDVTNKKVKWESGDTGVATVNENGVVTAVGEGIATISATSELGNVTTVCTVTVDYPSNDEEDHTDDPYMEDDYEVGEIQGSESNTPSYDTNTPLDTESTDSETVTEGDVYIEDTEDRKVEELLESVQTGSLYLVEENIVTDIETLISINETKSVQIKNDDSVIFTFPIGRMFRVDGIEEFDFSTELIYDADKMADIELENCILGINYSHSGDLPGIAVITIPVGQEWSGHRLYYYQVLEDGTCSYAGKSAVVDEDGNYSISQTHCSDYVLSTTRPVREDDTQESDLEKENNLFLYIGIAGIVVVVALLAALLIVFTKRRK